MKKIVLLTPSTFSITAPQLFNLVRQVALHWRPITCKPTSAINSISKVKCNHIIQASKGYTKNLRLFNETSHSQALNLLWIFNLKELVEAGVL